MHEERSSSSSSKHIATHGEVLMTDPRGTRNRILAAAAIEARMAEALAKVARATS
jgi:hypothetical protein